MTRIRPLLVASLAAALALAVACAPAPSALKPAKIRLGVIPLADPLPFWAAERDGAFKRAGLDVVIYVFPSTLDREQALADGKLDAVIGDLIEIASQRSRGVELKAVMLLNGPSPPFRYSGLVVRPGSKITSLKELVDVPIATSEGTLQEYVLDSLMAEIGVPHSKVRKLTVAKVPVRLQMLTNGQVQAAMLGEPNLSLALQRGARLIADDSKGPNLSQEVLDFRADYLAKPEGAEAVRRLLAVWDEEVAKINASPNDYRTLLFEKASVPKSLETSYELTPYPTHKLPQPADVERLLRWVRTKKLLTRRIGYADLVWSPPGGP